MNCAHCGGLVLRDRQDGDLVCMVCNRTPAGTRAPLPEESLRKRGQRTGPRFTMEASQHYGDALDDERRCSAVTELGVRCRNPAKVAGRCSTLGHRAVASNLCEHGEPRSGGARGCRECFEVAL